MGALACGSVDTYTADIERIRETLPTLAGQLATYTGIAQVVEWLSERGVGRDSIDIVAMDEFEYDFLVEAQQEGCWLAFGVT